MKTERRHELQTNELAAWLAVWIDKLRPYSRAIVGCVVLGVAVSMAYTYVNHRGEQARAQAWSDYFREFQAGNVEGLSEVATSYPGTDAGLWALQSAADLRLATGAGELFRDPDGAKEDLEAARDAYQQVAEATGDTMLKQRALFGVAQSLESLGDVDGAIAQYNSVNEVDRESVVAVLAQERVGSLSTPGAKAWYAWFAEQKPAESPLSTPGLFQDLPNLPDNPDLQLPAAGQFLTPSASGAPSPEGSAPDPGSTESEVAPPAESETSIDLPESIEPPTSTDEEATPETEPSVPDPDANPEP